VINQLKISEDVYKFIENVPLEREKIKELVEYIHYKSMLDLFTIIIENKPDVDLEFLLPDYVEIISKLEVIIKNISKTYEKECTTSENES
jgi:hypothetical protein